MRTLFVMALGFLLLVPRANAQPAVLIATYLFDAPSPGGTRAPTYMNPLVLSDAGDFYNPMGSTGLLPIPTPAGYYAIGPTGGNNRALIARNWATTVNALKYFGDTLKPVTGQTLVIDSVTMYALSSPMGPLNSQAGTNITGYTTTVGAVLVNNTAPPWKKWKIIPVGVSSASLIDFRFYAYAGTADANTTWRIDSVKFYGHLLGIYNLPIELLSFTGEAQERDVLLNWSTATETNNDYFTVLKSYDLLTWNVVGTTSGAGTSVSTQSYSLFDRFPIIGTNYYKLRQTDFDGRSEEFPVIAVEWNVDDGLTRITDVSGHEVRGWSMTHDLTDLPAGMYFAHSEYRPPRTIVKH